METNHVQSIQMPTSMLEVGALYRIYYFPAGGTSRDNSACGVAGGIIVFNVFGGFINSAGGAGISIFGTKRVNGLPQAARNKKESATRNFIFYSPMLFLKVLHMLRLQINSS
jgi:hypothetical protein